MTRQNASAGAVAEAESEVSVLEDISRETYELVLRDSEAAGEQFLVSYYNGRMVIDRRGTNVAALEGISWETYEHLLRDLDEQHLRLTYDQGRLSIVSPSPLHERVKTLVGRLVGTVSDAFEIPVSSFGSATWRRSDLGKGLEADESYYIQSEPRVRGKDDIDLAVDPPPDLVVEIDITRRSVARLPVYAALGVPELWQYRGKEVRAFTLRSGVYVPIDTSVAFPMIRPAELNQFLAMRHTVDELTLIKRFRAWLRTLTLPDRQA